jgi:hypothetical protein
MLSSKGSGRIGYLLGTSENLVLIFFRFYGKPKPFAIASLLSRHAADPLRCSDATIPKDLSVAPGLPRGSPFRYSNKQKDRAGFSPAG